MKWEVGIAYNVIINFGHTHTHYHTCTHTEKGEKSSARLYKCHSSESLLFLTLLQHRKVLIFDLMTL